MWMTEKREKLLQTLLAQFFIPYFMTRKEGRDTYAYLFKGVALPPMFKDIDLYDTLTYLRDVASDMEIRTLAGLLEYIEQKKTKMGAFLDELIDNPEPDHSPKTGEYFVLNDYPEMDSFLLSKAVKNPPSAVGPMEMITGSIRDRRSGKSLQFEQYSEYYEHVLKGLGLAYLKAFVSPKDNGRFCILDREGNDQGVMESGSYTILPACDYNRLAQVEETPADRVYQHIMTLVERQLPIWGLPFKQLLVEWIFKMKRSINLDILGCYGPGLYLRRWIILKSPEKQPWMTSDSPGFLVEEDCGIVLHYPLSRDFCLRIQPEPRGSGLSASADTPIHFIQFHEQEAKLVNERTVSSSNELVVTSEKRDFRQVIGCSIK
jgi:hypothetical protein